MSVTVYTTGSGCIRCRLSAKLLKDLGITFDTVDIRTDPDARRYVTEELGYAEAPVVVVTDTGDDKLPHETPLYTCAGENQNTNRRHWSGFRPDQLTALAQAQAQHEAGSRIAHPQQAGSR